MAVGSAWYRDLDQLEQELRQVVGAPEIEGYSVRRCLHRGGQGVVFEARELASDRRVAIKMLRDGSLATIRARRRFERELELLSQVDHPGIVRVLGHDRTVDGEPYLVMELVEGEPIDLVVDRERRETLTPACRSRIVKLLIDVADALRHAHQRGIIHRDLKPSNILVEQSGAVRIVDFGLARDITGETSITRSEEGIAGSIAWMSPEHVQGSSASIDARSDIYAVGLILHRLLSGEMAYDTKGTLAQTLKNIERASPSSVASIEQVGEDLAAVVSKCLAKDPNARYQTTEELRHDLKSVQEGLPIEAHRRRALARSMQTLRRYRTALTVGAVVLCLVASIAVAMTMLWRRADNAEALARGRAESARLAAEREQVANDLLEALLARLQGGTVSPAAVLARLTSGAQLDGEHPEMGARLHHALGDAHAATGNWRAAEQSYANAVDLGETAFGVSHRELVPSLLGLAEALARRADPQAPIMYGASLRIRQRLFEISRPELSVILRPTGDGRPWGQESQRVFVQGERAAARAESILRASEEDTRLELARALVTQAKLQMWRGRVDRAISLFEEARRLFIALGATHDAAHVDALQYSANLSSNLGRLEAATTLYQRALLLAPQTHGAWVRPQLLWELAWIRHRMADSYGAIDLYRDALSEICRLAALEHPENEELELLGTALESPDFVRYDELISALRDVPDFAPDGVSWYRLALSLNLSTKPKQSEIVLREAIERIQGELGFRNPWYGRALGALGIAVAMQGRHNEAEALARLSYEHACLTTGQRSRCRNLAMQRLGMTLTLTGQDELANLAREAARQSNTPNNLSEILPDSGR